MYNVSVQNVTNANRNENKLQFRKKSVLEALPNLLVYFLSAYLEYFPEAKNVVTDFK